MFITSRYRLYKIRFPKYWLVRDESVDMLYSPEIENSPHTSMLFHISAGDYLSTLATILRFFEETISDEKTTPEMRKLQLETMKDLRNDLLYLHRHYAIVPRDGKEI